MNSFHRSTLKSIAWTDRRSAAQSEQPRFLFKSTPKARVQTEPSQPSQVRLIIHSRLERRLQHQHRLLITSIACNVLLVIVLVAGIWGAVSVSAFYQDTQSKLDRLANPTNFPQTTRFYDRDGNLLWEMLGSENTADYRTYVPLGIIPPDVMNATVDTEDKSFWTNNGVDVTSIFRASLDNITIQQINEGGSTITQQLMKDAFFVDPKTGVAAENLQRKIQSALMAYAVTQHYRKQDILEFYLNIIFYGYLSQGIEAAAENYFNKCPLRTLQPTS